jgi:hypothetical protein
MSECINWPILIAILGAAFGLFFIALFWSAASSRGVLSGAAMATPIDCPSSPKTSFKPEASIAWQPAEPLTSRDIALEMLVTRALDKNDQKLLALMTKRVGVALRIQRVNGIVRSASGPGQYMVWEIARHHG